MIRYVKGNILETDCNIIVHSVNHKGVMGAGLARQLREKYPAILGEYYKICKEYTFEEVLSMGLVAWYHARDGKSIASVFGQDDYGRDKQYTNYVYLLNGLNSVRLFAQAGIEFNLRHPSIAIPSGIGCGLGGGQWNIVEELIKECFEQSPEIEVKIYQYENMYRCTP